MWMQVYFTDAWVCRLSISASGLLYQEAVVWRKLYNHRALAGALR